VLLSLQRVTDEEDLGDHGEHREGDQMPPQAQAIELMCLCDDVPDDGVELRILKGLLTAATSSTLHLHGQACYTLSCYAAKAILRPADLGIGCVFEFQTNYLMSIFAGSPIDCEDVLQYFFA
jgi:hypothetical protein